MRSPTIWPSPRRTHGAHAEGGARARASCFGSRTCRGWAEAIRMPRHAPAGHFKTSRLTFSPIVLDDASRIFDGYASRELSTRFMNFARHESLAESEAWAARCVDCWNDGSAFPWTLKQRHTGAYIGNLELRVALRKPISDTPFAKTPGAKVTPQRPLPPSSGGRFSSRRFFGCGRPVTRKTPRPPECLKSPDCDLRLALPTGRRGHNWANWRVTASRMW